MIIAVEGTKLFSDYETFMRAMGVALSELKQSEPIEVWSAGPHNVNNFTAAFCNSAENYLRQKGHKISFKKLPHTVIADRIAEINYFAFFTRKNEKNSKLLAAAELSGVETGIFKS